MDGDLVINLVRVAEVGQGQAALLRRTPGESVGGGGFNEAYAAIVMLERV